MMIHMSYKAWKQAKRDLKLVKSHNTKNRNTGQDCHSYLLTFSPKNYYPRFHLLTSDYYRRKIKYQRLIDIHIDFEPHKNSVEVHQKIMDLVEILKSYEEKDLYALGKSQGNVLP